VSSGFGPDVLLSSPGAALATINTTRWLDACVPATLQLLQQLEAQPQAQAHAGLQVVRQVKQQLCLAGRGVCFSEHIQFDNWTAANAAPLAEGKDEVRD
jgi:hypothetical protein